LLRQLYHSLAIGKTVTPLGCTTFGAVTITTQMDGVIADYTLTQPDATVLNNNTGVLDTCSRLTISVLLTLMVARLQILLNCTNDINGW
jgi:hypothetical protein